MRIVVIGIITLFWLGVWLYHKGKEHIGDLKLVPGVTDAVIGRCEIQKEDVCLVECKDCMVNRRIMEPGRSCQHLNQTITMEEFDRRKKIYKDAKNHELTEEEKRKYQAQQDYQTTNVPEHIYKDDKNGG